MCEFRFVLHFHSFRIFPKICVRRAQPSQAQRQPSPAKTAEAKSKTRQPSPRCQNQIPKQKEKPPSPAQPSPAKNQPSPRSKNQIAKAKAKPGKTSQNPPKLRTQTLYNFYSPEPTARKQKQKQNLAKPGKTPDPNPIQFLSPHKEGATYLDDDRSRPCRRFLQNRFVCLLLKHNPFKSRAQPRANQSPRAHSPEPTAQKTKAKAKPPKTRQNPPKPP